jgi:hypothetical protein
MVIDVVIFIVIVVLTMTVLTIIFGGWLIVALVRGAGRVLTGPAPSGARSLPASDDGRQCPQRGCRTTNPAEARFCRRCGTPLTGARSSSSSTSAARRAACW